jgi:cell wall-associated NlpC family hydrolase
MLEQEKYRHDICSPTSLAMVLEYWGENVKTAELAETVRDQKTEIFGHWPFNVAAAGRLGVPGYAAWLGGLGDLEVLIARGRPVVVSLTFGAGELANSPIKKTRGHLVVVAGFTEKGDVIVFDPAAPQKDSVRRVYDREEFRRAWLVNKRGLAYIIGPLSGSAAVIGVPVADLYQKPAKPAKINLTDSDHLSQLLYGERVTILKTRGDWAYIGSDEQPSFAEGAWRPYQGWTEASALSSAEPIRYNAVVRTRQALAQNSAGILILSVGTRLERDGTSGNVSHVRLLDQSRASLPTDALLDLPVLASDESRAQLIKTTELFLGTSYYWGGRSGVQSDLSVGVDCSGLVQIAYRVHGLDLPRDSHDLWLEARPVRSRELKPGDLIFLSDPKKPKRISHVMLYTGGDGFIESRQSSGRVLRSSFTERFGQSRAQIESGDLIEDRSFAKPRPRRIYFGAFL